MDKRETIKITGVSHYADNIKKLMFENPDFDLSNKELLEAYDEGDEIREYETAAKHVELIPEPENEHDSNAVRCDIEGVTVGYVKSGSCSHVKNLLASPDFKYVMIDKLLYGNAKRVYSDDDGKNYVELKEFDGPVVHLIIATGDASEAVAPAPQATIAPTTTGASKQSIPLALLIMIVVFSLILLIAFPLLGVVGIVVAIVLFVLKKKKEGNNGER